jgi:hypothetical protein
MKYILKEKSNEKERHDLCIGNNASSCDDAARHINQPLFKGQNPEISSKKKEISQKCGILFSFS